MSSNPSSTQLQLEQREAEFSIINSVQQAIMDELDMQAIYDLVGNKIKDIFNAQVVGIYSIDVKKKMEYFRYLNEDGERIFPKPRGLDKVRLQLVKTKQLIHIDKNFAQKVADISGVKPKAVPGTKLPKTIVFVPMVVRGIVKGYVSIQNLDEEKAFSHGEVRLLSTLTNSLSVALENARLFNETEQRNAELAVINSIQEGLVAEMDMQGIYDLVGDKIQHLFDAQVVGIATFDHEKQQENFRYLYENGEKIDPEPRDIDKIREQLITTKKLLDIKENSKQAYIDITGNPPTAVSGTEYPKSMIYVPMLIGDTVRGYVTLQNLDKEHAFSDSDTRLLSTLTNSMSVALENARLFNETEQRNAELAVINSVQVGLVAEMDMQGIYDLVGNKIRNLFDAQVTGIYSFDHDLGIEHFHYLFEDGERLYPASRPLNDIRKWIIKNSDLLLVNQDSDNDKYGIAAEKYKVVPGTRLPKSMLFVPLMVGTVVKGCVTLQNLDKEHAFSESDVRLLSTLANSMSVAIENARLFNETEQRNAEFAIINNVQEGLVREMDMQAIYELVGSRICEVLNTQTLIIRTFDYDTGLEHWEYAIENEEPLISKPRPFIWANQHLIKTKKALLINKDFVETAKKYGDKNDGISEGLAPKAAIFVPMLVGDEVKGSVSLQNVEREDAFTDLDVRLLSTLTNSMSVALENARLFNETKQRATELQTVNSISKAMVSHLEFDTLIELVGEQMIDTFKADIVYLALHDRDTDMLHFPFIHGEKAESRPFANGITEKIINNKKPLLINKNMDEAYTKIKADVKGVMVQSYLGVPIIAGSNNAIGVISVQSTKLKNRFDLYDQRLLTTIAANLGIAIQNAEAYQKLQAALTELKDTQQQLIQSEKMASLGELTAGIAHEIQNPLNFVNNFSEVSGELLEELDTEIKTAAASEIEEIISDLKQNLTKINQHGKRASSIVKGMLDHSRTSSGTKELTDINILADEYLRLTYHGLRAKDRSFNANFKTVLDEHIPKVSVVPQDFGRVILNLINNAFYAVRRKEKRGTEDYTPTVTVSTKTVGATIEIKVKDNGDGISKEISEKIFQPFFTTKPSGEGTGLGLSLAYDIVTKGHNGQLTVASKKGEGTVFTVTIPTNL